MTKPLLLFIHGLGGDPQDTWGKFDALIKQDVELGKRIETGLFGYPTHRWPFRRSLKIQDISKALKTEIDIRYKGYDRIVLVCHSLGGLVAKHYICHALKEGTPLRIQGV